MAVWNGEAHVASAIRSVLAQSFCDFEFLILDDGSTDSTPEILRGCSDPRIRVVRLQANRGLTVCLNRGLELARAPLIARQDADDEWHPSRLELQVAFLARHSQLAVVGSQAALIDERGRSLGKKNFPLTHRAIEWMHIFDNALAHASVLFRKREILKAGGYDPEFPVSQDFALWTRVSESASLANLPQRLLYLRVRPQSLTRSHSRPELIRRIQREHLQRLFPRRGITDAEVELIGQFRSSIAPDSLPGFHRLFSELLREFQATRPETRHCSDFRRTLALQFERIGYNLIPLARRLGWRELLRAVRTWPPVFFRLPWARMIALTLLGNSARSFYRKISVEHSG